MAQIIIRVELIRIKPFPTCLFFFFCLILRTPPYAPAGFDFAAVHKNKKQPGISKSQFPVMSSGTFFYLEERQVMNPFSYCLRRHE